MQSPVKVEKSVNQSETLSQVHTFSGLVIVMVSIVVVGAIFSAGGRRTLHTLIIIIKCGWEEYIY